LKRALEPVERAREAAAADRLAVESANAQTEHQRSEQVWAPVFINFGPQNCGAAAQTLLATGRALGDPRLLRFCIRFCLQRAAGQLPTRGALDNPKWRG
jgi:hypothetical protein